MSRPLATPVVVVTGAAGLIGRQITAVLDRRGVVAVGWDVATTTSDSPGIAGVDIADETAVQAACADTIARHGGIDALVHAAAFTGRSSGMKRHTLRDVDLLLWERALRINLTGALVCARELGARLRPGPRAQIVLIGSIQGTVPTMGHSAYAVSKAAMAGLTRQLAAEFAGDGVRVNLFTLGPIAGDEEIAAPRSSTGELAPTPLGRFGTPLEIAETIADVVTGHFSYLTGAVVPLDGGEHLRPRTEPGRRHPDA